MGCFSRASSASAKAPCAACCRADHAKDDELSQASSARIAVLTGRRGPVNAASAPGAASGAPSGRVNSDCAQQARALAPVVQRFDRYREALPSARAAADMNELGDKPGDVPSAKPCLTRLPMQAQRLNATLGVPPGTIKDTDLRNDDTGFRAALYRDEGTGKVILVPRDTQPDSLVDWQANIRNGLGIDTPQYQAMRNLTSKLAANDQMFDIAGYSKGGGLAQQGGLMSDLSQVRLFNSAGAPAEMLAWSGKTDFDSLTARTKAFSSEGDFLTFMNTTTDPGQNIINSRFLQRELAGQGPGLNPINIKVRNPAMRGADDPEFAGDKQAYMGELLAHIDDMQAAYDSGGVVQLFPAVRAGSKEVIGGSMTLPGKLLGAGSDQPRLGKLAQHKMGVVLDALETSTVGDRQRLQEFMKQCG
ncbi:hypothetical protein [Scleromatobacter humisilvae]|uniref:DUF2974 domain-containing protein n=1 Tax=Scleromatobacter humisilvae TaxID=2897159 RepID=A0A9X2C485_9BURK|nr:hypothetical protein [Scleromatobacter humisilvae]MCK9689599.1 hypothetical protein [Scleromatobacter humisilvae]